MSADKKKRNWRAGVVVSGPGRPDKPAREGDAMKYLRLAAREPDPEKRERRLFSAQVCQILGSANESMVDLTTYKPGRPKGERLGAVDAPMRKFMKMTAAETDEKRPYRLARLAVEAANIKEAHREADVRRLVRWWKRQRPT